MHYPDMKEYITFLFFFCLMSLLKLKKPLSVKGDRKPIQMLHSSSFMR